MNSQSPINSRRVRKGVKIGAFKTRRQARPRYGRVAWHKPTWTTFYYLGIEASKRLTPIKTYREIAAALGITPQNLYTECMLALGKVVYAMRQIRGPS